MAVTKEFAHFVKPMIIKDPPQHLYKEKCIWMEAKDMEGFAHFLLQVRHKYRQHAAGRRHRPPV